ncbi:hypothetical protein PENTCL1PPCAC_5163, partial [Pristionchus entomophagus]
FSTQGTLLLVALPPLFSPQSTVMLCVLWMILLQNKRISFSVGVFMIVELYKGLQNLLIWLDVIRWHPGRNQELSRRWQPELFIFLFQLVLHHAVFWFMSETTERMQDKMANLDTGLEHRRDSFWIRC